MWHTGIAHSTPGASNSNLPRNKVTMLQYACYRLAIRDTFFSLLHRSQKLFLQWIVDMYVRVEGTRLNYIRMNQGSLRTELYNNLTDYVADSSNVDTTVPIGRS